MTSLSEENRPDTFLQLSNGAAGLPTGGPMLSGVWKHY